MMFESKELYAYASIYLTDDKTAIGNRISTYRRQVAAGINKSLVVLYFDNNKKLHCDVAGNELIITSLEVEDGDLSEQILPSRVLYITARYDPISMYISDTMGDLASYIVSSNVKPTTDIYVVDMLTLKIQPIPQAEMIRLLYTMLKAKKKEAKKNA